MVNFPLLCPVCSQPLTEEAHRFLCPAGHTFDRAKEGYVHLLPANQKHSPDPGDTREMVGSRRLFLESGYYNAFAEQLAYLTGSLLQSHTHPVILDIGCGEGFYTRYLKKAAGPQSVLCGIDISKWAVRLAARKNKDCTFAVASVFHLPAASQSVDLAVNVFAPMAETEICRVLKPHGYLIYAVPGPRHLYQLKEAVYDQPYENERRHTDYKGLTFLRRIPVEQTLTLRDPAAIQALFAMTPYFWKTPKEGCMRLKQLKELITEIHFDFLLYQKETESTLSLEGSI